jgi:hypothetical protein
MSTSVKSRKSQADAAPTAGPAAEAAPAPAAPAGFKNVASARDLGGLLFITVAARDRVTLLFERPMPGPAENAAAVEDFVTSIVRATRDRLPADEAVTAFTQEVAKVEKVLAQRLDLGLQRDQFQLDLRRAQGMSADQLDEAVLAHQRQLRQDAAACANRLAEMGPSLEYHQKEAEQARGLALEAAGRIGKDEAGKAGRQLRDRQEHLRQALDGPLPEGIAPVLTEWARLQRLARAVQEAFWIDRVLALVPVVPAGETERANHA